MALTVVFWQNRSELTSLIQGGQGSCGAYSPSSKLQSSQSEALLEQVVKVVWSCNFTEKIRGALLVPH